MEFFYTIEREPIVNLVKEYKYLKKICEKPNFENIMLK